MQSLFGLKRRTLPIRSDTITPDSCSRFSSRCRGAAQTGQAHDLIQVESLIHTYKQQAQQFLLGGSEEGLSDQPNLA
jgi:hypothetical protein